MINFYIIPSIKIYKKLNTIYFSIQKLYNLKYISLNQKNLSLKNNFLLYKFWQKKNYIITYQFLGLSNTINKDLKIIGRGFRVKQINKKLSFKLGFSHNILINIPKEIYLKFLKNNILRVSSNKYAWTQNFILDIKRFKTQNKYKGTGFYPAQQTVLLKKWIKKQ